MIDKKSELVTEMMTSGDVQRLLKITSMTLYRWRKKGIINYIEFPPKKYRYPKAEIERLMTKGITNHEK